MKIIILSLFTLLVAISCEQKSKYRKAADAMAANTPSAKNMNAGKANYSLYVPPGWTTAHQTAYGVNYYFILAPKTRKTRIQISTCKQNICKI